MPGWDDGYVTDVTYTTNFYREITPIWLATTCLLLGQRSPDLTRPFRYADLGCGHGFTALVVAAAHPQAEVWGFDFNPAHVEWASRLAEAAGLANAHFVETSFADLAARPEATLPPFDFMVAHGVLSWISAENRRLMLDVIRQRLRPGGLAYVSYNVTTGWAAMLPLRRLMWMLADANPARTDLAAAGTLDFIDRMRQAGALFFQGNPRVDSRLEDIRKPGSTLHRARIPQPRLASVDVRRNGRGDGRKRSCQLHRQRHAERERRCAGRARRRCCRCSARPATRCCARPCAISPRRSRSAAISIAAAWRRCRRSSTVPLLDELAHRAAGTDGA